MPHVIASLVAALLIAPSYTSAAVSTAGPSVDGTKDACKSGSLKTDASKGEVISGGGAQTKNFIYLSSSGHIQVSCRILRKGESPTVEFCDLENHCWVKDKLSKEGKNLMQLYDTAYEVGSPLRPVTDGSIHLGARRVDSETLLENMLSREQMDIVNQQVIGKLDHRNRLFDYVQIVDWAAWDSSGSTSIEDSFESAAMKQIESMASVARDPKPNPYSEFPININPNIERDWSKPNIVDFLPPWENATIMNELMGRQYSKQRTQHGSTFLTPSQAVSSNEPTLASYTTTPSNWFTRAYNSFTRFLFGR